MDGLIPAWDVVDGVVIETSTLGAHDSGHRHRQCGNEAERRNATRGRRDDRRSRSSPVDGVVFDRGERDRGLRVHGRLGVATCVGRRPTGPSSTRRPPGPTSSPSMPGQRWQTLTPTHGYTVREAAPRRSRDHLTVGGVVYSEGQLVIVDDAARTRSAVPGSLARAVGRRRAPGRHWCPGQALLYCYCHGDDGNETAVTKH